MELVEQTISSQLVFQGKIVTVLVDEALLPNGAATTREVVRHPGGVAVLPLAEDGTVTLVRQFRYPFSQVITEVPAGKLEPGEAHAPAGLRELEEEVGLTAGTFTYLGHILMSPGFCDEVLHMYLAQELTSVPCHPDDDEFVEPLTLPLEELIDQIMAGAITDAKTVAVALKAREHLRRQSL